MSIDYREKYKFLKRKLKILVYEHEALNQELEKSQRKLLKVARDRSFLMDRLLHYEQVVVDSPADSDVTLSSDSESGEPVTPRRKADSVKTSKSEPLRKNDAVLTAAEPADDKELKEADVTKEVDSQTNKSPLPTQDDTLEQKVASETGVA